MFEHRETVGRHHPFLNQCFHQADETLRVFPLHAIARGVRVVTVAQTGGHHPRLASGRIHQLDEQLAQVIRVGLAGGVEIEVDMIVFHLEVFEPATGTPCA